MLKVDIYSQSSCKRCGKCCKAFTVEVTDKDVQREPKLKYFIRPVKEAKTLHGEMRRLEEKYFFAEGKGNPCPFLNKENNACYIYNTRPDTCRRYIPSIIVCGLAELELRGIDVIGTVQKAAQKDVSPRQVFEKLLSLL